MPGDPARELSLLRVRESTTDADRTAETTVASLDVADVTAVRPGLAELAPCARNRINSG
jgi:hypothetical protein